MKRIIISLMVILLPLLSFSQIGDPQQYIGISIDARNAVVGSAPTNDKPELDFLIYGGVTNPKGFTMEIGYERFKAIEFQRMYVSAGITVISPNEKWEGNLMGELNLISRNWHHPNWTGIQNYRAPGLLLRTKFNVTEHHGIHIGLHSLLRNDNKERYHFNHAPVVNSIYAGYTYTFNK